MPEPRDEFTETGDLDPDSAPFSGYGDEQDYPEPSLSPLPAPPIPDNLSRAEEEKAIRDAVKAQVRQERIAADAREEAEYAEDEEDDDGSDAATITDEDMDEIAGVDPEDVLGTGDGEPDDFSDITGITDEQMDEIAGTGEPRKKRRPPMRKIRITPRGEQFGGVGRVGY